MTSKAFGSAGRSSLRYLMNKPKRKHIVYIFGTILFVFIVWFLFLGGAYPQFHHFQDVNKVVIRVTDINENDNWPNPIYRKINIDLDLDREQVFYERILTDEKEIDEFRNVLGVTWDGFFPENSHELASGPRCNIKIVQSDGSVDSIIFTHRDWGNAGVTPKRMIDYMKMIMR